MDSKSENRKYLIEVPNVKVQDDDDGIRSEITNQLIKLFLEKFLNKANVIISLNVIDFNNPKLDDLGLSQVVTKNSNGISTDKPYNDINKLYRMIDKFSNVAASALESYLLHINANYNDIKSIGEELLLSKDNDIHQVTEATENDLEVFKNMIQSGLEEQFSIAKCQENLSKESHINAINSTLKENENPESDMADDDLLDEDFSKPKEDPPIDHDIEESKKDLDDELDSDLTDHCDTQKTKEDPPIEYDTGESLPNNADPYVDDYKLWQ